MDPSIRGRQILRKDRFQEKSAGLQRTAIDLSLFGQIYDFLVDFRLSEYVKLSIAQDTFSYLA